MNIMNALDSIMYPVAFEGKGIALLGIGYTMSIADIGWTRPIDLDSAIIPDPTEVYQLSPVNFQNILVLIEYVKQIAEFIKLHNTSNDPDFPPHEMAAELNVDYLEFLQWLHNRCSEWFGA